jgi:thiamine pyrophosphate-dependent acetolactate synthase large subunit-like protein
VNRPIDVPLVGDIRGVLPQLVEALRKTPRKPAAGLEKFMKDGQAELDHWGKESESRGDGSGDTPMHTSRFVVESTRAFPKDGILIRDGGATVIFQWTYSQCKPHDVIWNQNFGHIGTGLPYATGAMLADQAATGKKRPGMLITSDSSFLFHIGELETAVRCKLPLVCVIGVDYQWGLEVGVYKRTFGKGTAETGTHWGKSVRFDKIGEGFGCHGEYVTKAADIRPAIERAYASGKVGVIHVNIDPTANSEEMPKYAEFRTWYAEGTQ